MLPACAAINERVGALDPSCAHRTHTHTQTVSTQRTDTVGYEAAEEEEEQEQEEQEEEEEEEDKRTIVVVASEDESPSHSPRHRQPTRVQALRNTKSATDDQFLVCTFFGGEGFFLCLCPEPVLAKHWFPSPHTALVTYRIVALRCSSHRDISNHKRELWGDQAFARRHAKIALIFVEAVAATPDALLISHVPAREAGT
jgi:hypothetical protein